MTNGAIWMVAGLAVAALEMLAPGAFLLWIGLAALIAGLATEHLGLGWHAQLAAFLLLTAILIAAAALFIRRKPAATTINTPSSGLIGQTCRVLDFNGNEGRVALGDGTWYARLAPSSDPSPGSAMPGPRLPDEAIPGQTLKVVGLDGTTLLVAANG